MSMSPRPGRLAGLLICLLGMSVRPVAALAETGVGAWPREFGGDGRSVLVYEPEVESWSADGQLRLHAPVAVTAAAGAPARYGVLDLASPTEVDARAQSVLLAAPQASARFQGLSDSEAAQLQTIVRSALPDARPLTLSLPALIAAGGTPPVAAKPVAVDLDPPPIFHSTQPATLLSFYGPPDFQPLGDGRLQAATNTGSTVLYDPDERRYYLALADAWLVAPDLRTGPWTQPVELPAAVRALPADTWGALTAHGPGQRLLQLPAIVYTEQPAELIVTDGAPRYVPVPGTRLQAVQNTDAALFLLPQQRLHYFLDAGRWFSAPTLAGPWQAATDALPPDFARIPPDGPYGWVLASVPGTPAAAQAVALASVPRKATVRRDRLHYAPVFDGDPRYQPIDGTGGVDWVVNTRNEVVRYQSRYYGVDDGVWFVADAPGGPWRAAEQVPDAIYRIPPSHPLYHDTYVRVYDSTPDTVTYGYTSGYAGQYVSNGVLMLGVGALAGWALSDHGHRHGGHDFDAGGDRDGFRPWARPDLPGPSYGYGAVYQPGQGFVSRERSAEYARLAPLPAVYDDHRRSWQAPAAALRPTATTATALTPFAGSDPYRHWGGGEAARDARWQQARALDDTHPAPAGRQPPIFLGRDGGLYRRTADDDWQRVATDGRTEAVDRTQAVGLVGAGVAHRGALAPLPAPAEPRSGATAPAGSAAAAATGEQHPPVTTPAAAQPQPAPASPRPPALEAAHGAHGEPAPMSPALPPPASAVTAAPPTAAGPGGHPAQPVAPAPAAAAASPAAHAAPPAPHAAPGPVPAHPLVSDAPHASPDARTAPAPATTTHAQPHGEPLPPAAGTTPHPASAPALPSAAPRPAPSERPAPAAQATPERLPAPVHAAPPSAVHPASPAPVAPVVHERHATAPAPQPERPAPAAPAPHPQAAPHAPPSAVHPASPAPVAPAVHESHATAPVPQPERPAPAAPAPHPQPAAPAVPHPQAAPHAPAAAAHAPAPAPHPAAHGSGEHGDKEHHKPEG